jgi:hypothetical protein
MAGYGIQVYEELFLRAGFRWSFASESSTMAIEEFSAINTFTPGRAVTPLPGITDNI